MRASLQLLVYAHCASQRHCLGAIVEPATVRICAACDLNVGIIGLVRRRCFDVPSLQVPSCGGEPVRPTELRDIDKGK